MQKSHPTREKNRLVVSSFFILSSVFSWLYFSHKLFQTSQKKKKKKEKKKKKRLQFIFIYFFSRPPTNQNHAAIAYNECALRTNSELNIAKKLEVQLQTKIQTGKESVDLDIAL